MGSWTLGLAVCVLAAAALLAARQPSQSTDSEPVQARAATPAPVVQARARITAASAPAAVSAPSTASASTPSAVSAPAAETEATVQESSAVTITGCLERDDETFRLKDTAGTDVPKSRSWKSGFLKKGSASIEVVDAANRLDLPNHVGRRVSVSGTRVDREMQARSLRRVAASC